MTTEPTYDPEALAGTPLDDLTLSVAKLDAALWIFRQWESRPTDEDAPDFVDGIPETEVLYAIHALVGEARNGIKEILAKYAADREASS